MTGDGGPAGRSPEAAELLERLAAVPLFSGFAPEELDPLLRQAELRDHHRGELLWEAGDPGHEVLVVLEGELAVWGPGDGGGAEVVVARLRAGTTLGEIALLLEERRSARVSCTRRARVLALGRPVFAELRRDPRVLAHLAESLSDRLARVTSRRALPPTTLVVGVVGHPGTTVAPALAEALTRLLARMTGGEVLHVRARGPAPARATGVRTGPDGTARHDVAGDDPALVAAAVDDVLASPARWRAVVLDVHDGDDRAAREVCDAVVHVTPTPDLPALEASTEDLRRIRFVELAPSAPPVPVDRCEPFLLPPAATETGGDHLARLVERLVEDASDPRARVVHRLARSLLGASVGIALGGGAAFGIAHVGVLLALEEGGIPVDLVAGTSMGSIVGLGYAAGVSPTEMLEVARRIGNVRTTLSALDPAVSWSGILAGRRMQAIFAPVAGDVREFHQLVVPARTVATDIETGERVEIGDGSIVDAFRASAAVPVLFTPARRDGRTLVDGAMVDPVPAEVARSMGADLVIGVNVVPQLRKGVTTALSRAFKRLHSLNPLARLTGATGAPDMVDVLMNSLQTVQYELGAFKAASADVLIAVDLAEFTWIEFYRALEIVERGREAGSAAVPALRAALDARLRTA